MPLAIRCHQLVKTYPGQPPVLAVRGLDLEVEAGECFGLLGPNGAGKTTTIEILEGLLPPTSGQVEVLGQSWGRHDRALKERLGIALQETKLPEKLSVLEVLRLFRAFYAQGPSPQRLIEWVGLEDKSHAWVKNLSGGQKQRLGVACALVGNPELVFLDEPTTGLDPQSRRQLWELIRAFRRQGRTVLLTTHYMDEAERLCDRVAIVDRGQVIACDTPRRLIAQLGGEHVVECAVAEPARVGLGTWKGLPGVRSARAEADHWSLTVGELHLALPALISRLADAGTELTSLASRHASLEDVFVTLTGRHLTESGETTSASAPEPLPV